MCLAAQKGQKRTSDTLELDLQALVSHLMWALGNEPRSCPGALSQLSGPTTMGSSHLTWNCELKQPFLPEVAFSRDILSQQQK